MGRLWIEKIAIGLTGVAINISGSDEPGVVNGPADDAYLKLRILSGGKVHFIGLILLKNTEKLILYMN